MCSFILIECLYPGGMKGWIRYRTSPPPPRAGIINRYFLDRSEV